MGRSLLERSTNEHRPDDDHTPDFVGHLPGGYETRPEGEASFSRDFEGTGIKRTKRHGKMSRSRYSLCLVPR